MAIPGGTYTQSNIIKHFKDMRLSQGAAYRKDVNNVFITSPQVSNIYFDAVRDVKKGGEPTVRYVNGVRQIRTEDNTAWIAEIADLDGTEFTALLNPSRMFYAFDAFSDTNSFKMLEIIRVSIQPKPKTGLEGFNRHALRPNTEVSIQPKPKTGLEEAMY